MNSLLRSGLNVVLISGDAGIRKYIGRILEDVHNVDIWCDPKQGLERLGRCGHEFSAAIVDLRSFDQGALELAKAFFAESPIAVIAIVNPGFEYLDAGPVTSRMRNCLHCLFAGRDMQEDNIRKVVDHALDASHVSY